MPRGLITSLLLKLTIDYWYLTVIALIIKLLLIRYTASNSVLKVFLIWITGTIAFYCTACLAGIIFTSIGFYYIPFIMYTLGVFIELAFTSILFRITPKILWPSLLIGDGVFFFLLFIQMI